jgi:hypothetical protein
MPATARPGPGLMRGYNGLHPTTRGYGINSPCCSRFERRVLSFAHALVGTVICASAAGLVAYMIILALSGNHCCLGWYSRVSDWLH